MLNKASEADMPGSLEFTGERMVPEGADSDTFWEHIHRYRFAARFVKDKAVLDIACGEGYGAAALKRAGARELIGVDISTEACEHARRRYGIETRVGDAQEIPLSNASVDTVVSFETIEHVPRPDLFLDECVRVLKPGGQIIISTPNREAYQESRPKNPYHFDELDEKSFVAVLKARFAKVEIYTQRPRYVAWWSPRIFASDRTTRWQRLRAFGLLRRVLRLMFCRELVGLKALSHARTDPVQAILKKRTAFSHLANSFAVRPQKASCGEIPIYLIAVASL